MRSSRAVPFRALSVLGVALLAVVLVAGISPGASKFLTKKKALKLFYTKAKADAAFINVGEKATSAGTADNATNAGNAANLDGIPAADFLRKGEIRIPQAGPWFPNAGAPGIVETYADGTAFYGRTFTYYQMDLVAPTRLGRQNYGLTEIEICYWVFGTGDFITGTELWDLYSAAQNIAMSNPTDQTSTTHTCYTVSPTVSPYVPAGALRVALNVSANGTTFDDSIIVSKVTSVWVPTSVAPARGVISEASSESAT